MTAIYTYSEARQHLASVLEKATQEGEVRVRRRDGTVYIIRPEKSRGSPLDVAGINRPVSLAEILASIAEGRRFT